MGAMIHNLGLSQVLLLQNDLNLEVFFRIALGLVISVTLKMHLTLIVTKD